MKDEKYNKIKITKKNLKKQQWLSHNSQINKAGSFSLYFSFKHGGFKKEKERESNDGNHTNDEFEVWIQRDGIKKKENDFKKA